MRGVDPRLLRHAPVARRGLGVLAGFAAAGAIAVVAQALTLAAALAAALDGRVAAGALILFVTAVAARAALLWARGAYAARLAGTVTGTLRADLVAAIRRRGPVWLAGRRGGELVTLTGRGLDTLAPYVTGYLPQLLLSVTVPVAVLATLTVADPRSALVVALTLPLIPLAGALLGRRAGVAARRQWHRMALLGGHFLDSVTGLATLRAFGRDREQIRVVRTMADEHRVATMRTLRVAFLSGLAVELVATGAVALVAVPVGLRLLDGALAPATALAVLLLAPEAYLPMRAMGARFHASLEGLTALGRAAELLDEPVPAPATARAVAEPRAAGPEIRIERVTVSYGETVALRDVSLWIRPGERVAVVGPSGGGKSTLLALLLGFVTPTAGRVLVDGVDLTRLDLDAWRRRLAWVPQRPHLFATSVADNIRLGDPDAAPAAVRAACRSATLDPVLDALPAGLDTVLGERGHGLSSGERQRVALARAYLRAAGGSDRLVLLDEPTARLDSASEAAVLAATERLLDGRTAILVAHRPALLAAADRGVLVDRGSLTELDTPVGVAR